MFSEDGAPVQKKPNLTPILLILIVILAGACVFLGLKVIESNNSNIQHEISDAAKFKTEYESLNGTLRNETDYYLSVEINEHNPMVYASIEEVKDLLKNGTGIVFFGFKECPWCRNLVPNLIDIWNAAGVDKVLYFNDQHIRDELILDENGEIVTEKEGTSDYYEILDILGDRASEYSGLNDSTIKRLYFPSVIYVRNGVIMELQRRTVDSHTDPYIPLNDEQKTELREIIKNNTNLVYPGKCSADKPGC